MEFNGIELSFKWTLGSTGPGWWSLIENKVITNSAIKRIAMKIGNIPRSTYDIEYLSGISIIASCWNTVVDNPHCNIVHESNAYILRKYEGYLPRALHIRNTKRKVNAVKLHIGATSAYVIFKEGVAISLIVLAVSTTNIRISSRVEQLLWLMEMYTSIDFIRVSSCLKSILWQ